MVLILTVSFATICALKKKSKESLGDGGAGVMLNESLDSAKVKELQIRIINPKCSKFQHDFF